jgi:hypothetical protein
LFEAHDKENFEPWRSLSVLKSGDKMRERLQAAFDRSSMFAE